MVSRRDGESSRDAADTRRRERKRANARVYYHRKFQSAEAVEERRAFHRAYYRKRSQEPEFRAARRRDWAAHRATHRAEHNERERRRYWADRDKIREKRLARVYGMSRADYEAMLARQHGACAICKRVSERGLCVDHCHASGRVRGLLCRKCNMGLGLYDENPEFVRAALAYLERSSGAW